MSQIATASITLKLDMRNFDKEFSQIKGAVSQLGSNLKNVGKNLQLDTTSFRAKLKNLSKDIQKVGQRAKDVGQNLSIGLTAPIVLMGASILKTAGNFEEAMNTLSANSQATAKQFDALKNKAKELGKNTVFSATEAGGAMDMLVRNGLKVEQVLDGVIESTLTLSVATGADLSTAADIATDAMANFGLKTKDLKTVVDNISGTLLNSKFNIQDYAGAMAQGGAIAGKLGVDFKDFNTSIAVTASAFSSGADAGTSFKTFLVSLAPTSKEAQKEIKKLGLNFFDTSGKMRPMSDIAGQLKKAFGGLSEEQKTLSSKLIFGTDAMRTALSLADGGSEIFDKFAQSIASVDAAEIMAKKMQGVNFALRAMGSAFEAVQLAISGSGMLEFATSFVNKITGMLRGIANLNPQILKIGTVIAGLAAAVGPLLVGFGILSTTVLPALVAGFGLLLSPITLVVAAVAGAAYLIISNWESISAYFTSGGGSAIFTKVKDIAIEAFDLIKSGIEKFVGFAKAIWAEHGTFITSIFTNAFTIISSIVNIVLDNILGTIRVFSKLFTGDFSGALETLENMFFSQFQNIAKIVFTVLDSILGSIGTWLGEIPAIGDEIKSTVDGLRESTKGFGKDLDDSLAMILPISLEIKNQNKEVASSYEDVKEEVDKVVNAVNNIDGSKLKINFDAGNLAPVELEIIPKLAKFETAFDTGNLPDFGGETNFDFKANFDVDAIREIAAELEIATNKGLLFGDSFNVITEQQAILKNEMIALLNEGILPQDPAVQQLKEKYEALGTSLDIPNEGLTKIAGSMINMAAAAIQSGESFAVAAHKIISALISQGITSIITHTLEKSGKELGPLALPLAAAAGVAASALFKKAIPKFAKGGIVSGRTLAEVGEYAGAAHNPEVIAPLDKLKSILGEIGGNGNFNDSGIIGAIQSMPGTTVNIDRDGFDIFNHENLARTRYLNKRKSWNSN